MTDEIPIKPQMRKDPRQPKSVSSRGVTSSPSPEPIWTEPPYMPCPSDECLPRLEATPAPATKDAPEPRPTMKRHRRIQKRLGESGSNSAPITRRMDEPISKGR